MSRENLAFAVADVLVFMEGVQSVASEKQLKKYKSMINIKGELITIKNELYDHEPLTVVQKHCLDMVVSIIKTAYSFDSEKFNFLNIAADKIKKGLENE